MCRLNSIIENKNNKHIISKLIESICNFTLIPLINKDKIKNGAHISFFNDKELSYAMMIKFVDGYMVRLEAL